MHAAEARISQTSEVRFRDAVAAVQIGYVIARNPKALREWQRLRPKGARQQVGLTGEALDRAMSGIIATHPEFLKGVPRPRHLQPHALMGKG